MNLVTDRWIPVVMPDGERVRVGLAELYERADQIRDLACTPPQRIALMRLLICITQAALDGPEDEEDWWGCRDRIPSSGLDYLKRWQDAFYLRGERPFLQVPGLTVDSDSSKPLDMLDCRLSSGNNPTLFDHEAVPAGRSLPDNDIAMNLITFLNFSTGGKVGQANWNGVKYSHSTFAAPCISYAHTFVRGENVLETLHFNLLTKGGVRGLPNGKWGQPVWESFPTTVDDTAAFENAAETYLGRLVPLSRFVSLSGDSPTQCIVGPTHKAYRISHLPAFREPSATIVTVREADRYMRLSSSRHMWRELGSLLSLRRGGFGVARSLSIENVVAFYQDLPETTVDVWVGGLENNKAAIVDMLEWTFTVPVSQFGEGSLNKYVKGVELADNGEKLLRDALRAFFAEMKMDSKQIPFDGARQRYWSVLDSRYPVLIGVANDAYAFLGDTWYPIVRKAMNETYAVLCTHDTPRQIEAFVKGQAKLRLRKPEE